MPFRRIRSEAEHDARRDTRRGLVAALVFFVLVAGFATFLTVIEIQTADTVSTVRAAQAASQSRSETTARAAESAVYDFAALEQELGTIIVANHLSLPAGEGVTCVPNTKTFAVKCSLVKKSP